MGRTQAQYRICLCLGHRPHTVAKGKHGPHSGESLVCVALDVLMECEGTIKEEAQVSPCGAWVEGGIPGVGGIAMVNVRVTVTVFPGEVKSFLLAVFEDQAHGLGQLTYNFVSQLKLNKVLTPHV
jgi:hypothetical protein